MPHRIASYRIATDGRWISASRTSSANHNDASQRAGANLMVQKTPPITLAPPPPARPPSPQSPQSRDITLRNGPIHDPAPGLTRRLEAIIRAGVRLPFPGSLGPSEIPSLNLQTMRAEIFRELAGAVTRSEQTGNAAHAPPPAGIVPPETNGLSLPVSESPPPGSRK